MMQKVSAALIAPIALVALLFPASTLFAADWKKIRIGVEGAYPPFSEVDKDGTLKGFDIDIAKALCDEMKAQCTLVQQDFDGMIPSLQARKLDAIIASMSITEERKKAVDFSDKYYQTPARLVARAGSTLAASAAGLKGRKIGVQRSTIHDRFATDTFRESEIVRYTKQDDVFLDLGSGRLDACLVDMVAAATGFLKTPQGQGFAFIGPVFNDVKYFGIGAGVAVRKTDTGLRDKFNAAIKAIRANGAYRKLQDRYFDFDVYSGETAAVAKK